MPNPCDYGMCEPERFNDDFCKSDMYINSGDPVNVLPINAVSTKPVTSTLTLKYCSEHAAGRF